MTANTIGCAALVSLEPWDDTWRRNQHLVHQLVLQGLAQGVHFIAPPTKLRHVASFRPSAGIQVTTPHLILPRRHGGRRLVALELIGRTRRADLLWVNDPVLGNMLARAGQPVVYDVTDDWRETDLPPEERQLLIASEDRLAAMGRTIVCSSVLADRWQSRYGFRPMVIQNGVDLHSHESAKPETLPGRGQHIVYVGTLHRERLDVELILHLARSLPEAHVDLVGPNFLDEGSSSVLQSCTNIHLHGPVPHHRVPGIMAGADVLICPHLVSAFTMSLDAIKSYEYTATGRPIVATPSSGFQDMTQVPGVMVVDASSFAAAVEQSLQTGAKTWKGRASEASWSKRATQFFIAATGSVSD